MSDHLTQACEIFARSLASAGVDPNRVTIVLEPRDRAALSDYALRKAGMGVEKAVLRGTIKIGELTFLEWREPQQRG